MKNRLLLTVMCFLSVLCMKAEDVVFVVDGIKYSTGIEYDKDRPAEGIGVKVYADETLYKELTEVVIPDEVTYEDVTYKVVELGSNLNFNGASSKVQKLTIGANVKTIVSPLGKDNLKAIRFMGSEAPSINTAASGAVTWSGITAIAPAGALAAYQTAYSTVGFKSVVDANTLHAKSIAVSPIGNLHVGDAKDIVYEIVKFDPSDATPLQVNWTSSNTSVATVDANGHIDALAEGTTTITGQTNDAGWAITSFEVTVGPDLALITTDLSIYRREGRTLRFTGTPMGTVTFESSAPTVAHVDAEGHVSGLAQGTATITVKDGECVVGTCTVEVSSSYFEGYNYNYFIDDIWYELASGNATVCYKGDSPSAYADEYQGDVTIPSSVSFNGVQYTVTKIKGSAFLGCTGLTSISIPNSVTSIESSAFSGCSALESMTLPFVGLRASATSASNSTVFGTIFGTASYTGGISTKQEYGEGSWSISGPSTTNYVPSSLKSVTITGGNLLYGAFDQCTGLTNITLEDGVTSIGTAAFRSCTGITKFTIPNSVASIGSSAFRGCTGLVEVTIPNSVASIGSSAFQGCTGLVEVTIPNSVASIDSYAFADCTGLVEVTIPNSVASIGSYAFKNTSKVITCDGLVPPTLSSANAIETVSLIFVPLESLEVYRTAEYWSTYVNRIVAKEGQHDYDITVSASDNISSVFATIGEENLANVVSLKITGSINSHDFLIMRNKMIGLRHLDLEDATIVGNNSEYYSGKISKDNTLTGYCIPPCLLSIVLPKNITKIEGDAFKDCQDLREINVPVSVTEIGIGAFSGCGSLESMTLPFVGTDSSSNFNLFGSIFGTTQYTGGVFVRQYGTATVYREYYTPRNLKSVKILSGGIHYGAFYNCQQIKNITLPNDLKTIGACAFFGCGGIENIQLPQSLEEIGEKAFYSCPVLNSIAFPENLKSIGQYAFSSCPMLTKIEIPNSVETMEAHCFEGSALTSITIGQGVKILSESVFSGCTSLQEIAIPATVESIGTSAFNGCTSLTSCVLPTNSKVSSIGSSAFYGCTKLLRMDLPVSVRSIGANAFYNCSAMTEVKIPSGVTSIGDKAFSGCSKLNDIYTYTILPQEIGQNTFSTYTTATVHCPKVSYYNYYFNTQWSQFLKLVAFDEPYDYVYLAEDFEISNLNGTIDGTPDTEIEAKGGLIVKDDLTQELDEVTIKFNGTTNTGASLIGKVKANKIYLDLEVKANFWYAFCFPFDVNLKTIQKSGGYVFRYYDGQKRANGGSGWSEIAAGTEHLNAGEGYIFRTNEAGTLTIVVDKKTIEAYDLTVDKLTALNSYTATSGTTADDNKSWNFVGNPYLSYFDMNDLGYTAPVVTFNGTTYEALRPGDDEQVFYPFQAFFVQKPENVDGVGFGAADQTTYIKSQNAQKKAQARARKADALNLSRKLINLTLTDGTVIDKTRVVFNDEQKMTYEAECDAAKFSSEGVPQFFSLDAKGTKYAINERPMADGVVKLGFTAPAPGEYTISVTRMDAHVFLKDNQTGRMHDLSEGDYTFTASKGSDVKRFELVAADEETSISRVDADRNADEAAYDLNGRRVGKTQKGVNIVNGKKVMVK